MNPGLSGRHVPAFCVHLARVGSHGRILRRITYPQNKLVADAKPAFRVSRNAQAGTCLRIP